MLSTMKIKSFAAMALVGLALAGCGSSDNSSSAGTTTGTTTGTTAAGTGGTADAKKHLKLAFVTNNASDYWTIVRKGVEKAEKEDGNLEVDFQLPKPPEAADQKTIVENEITRGVDGIAISPADAKNQTEMLDAAAAKALLICQDSDAPQSKRTAYIGTDNHAAGVKLGEEIKKSLPNGGKIVVFVGSLDAQNAQDRIGGIEEALKGSNVSIIDKRTDAADHAKAKSNAADILVKTPDVAALVGIWSYNGPAILSAVQDANKVGKVKILCFDEEPNTLAGVKSGAIDATIVQQPYEFGYQGVQKMAKYLRGDKSAFPSNGLDIIDTKILHKDDIDAFKADLDKKRAG
jgi:ribose transport system substrate-binding protein